MDLTNTSVLEEPLPKMPAQKSPITPKRARVADNVEFCIECAFFCWIFLVLQDWLFSNIGSYPYTASALTDFGVLVGLFCFLKVRRLALWRDVILASGALLCAADILQIVPQGMGAVPAVAALTCGLATALLCSCKQHYFPRHWLYFAALAIAATALIRHAQDSDNLIWGVLVVLLTMNVSALCVVIARSRKTRLSTSEASSQKKLSLFTVTGSLLLLVGILVLLIKTLIPFNSSPTNARAWIGGAFGQSSYPVYWPGVESFAPLIAAEWGTLVLWLLGLIFLTSLGAAALVLWDATGGPKSEPEARVQLCAGAISSFYGMLLGAHLGPPFLTVDSISGTWVLALAVAATGIAATSHPSQEVSVRIASAVGEQTIAPRRRSMKRAACVISLATLVLVSGVVLYLKSLRQVLQPFAGDGPPHGFETYVSLADVSQPMRDATVAMEDGLFYKHSGIDWQAVHRALRVNLRAGRVRQGGSTITQQLAKNLFLTQDRTLARKLQEAALTLEMERTLSKNRILELYLNIVDYGMKQRGIAMAARYYFHKTPSQLTPAESALLVGMVPSPPQQKLSLRSLVQGQAKALSRMQSHWPNRYPQVEVDGEAEFPIRSPDFAEYSYSPSPNWDERSPGTVVNCVLLHATVKPSLERNILYFCNPASKVSTHFLIGKKGQIVQLVPLQYRAWHAGVSKLNGTSNVSDFSIGIEVVNLNDGRDPYTGAQYKAVATLIHRLQSRYSIPGARIVSHAQVAMPAGRKTDPRGFDFNRLHQLLKPAG